MVVKFSLESYSNENGLTSLAFPTAFGLKFFLRNSTKILAGDFVKYTFPLAWTMTMLSWTVIEHGAILEQTGQKDGLMDIIEWGVDWLLKANPEPRVLYAIVGDPSVDHQFRLEIFHFNFFKLHAVGSAKKTFLHVIVKRSNGQK